MPFPRGSGVTAAYKERIPTGTLHPQSPSTPSLEPLLFCREIPRDVCSISMTTATDRIGGDCVKRCSKRHLRQRGRQKNEGDKKTEDGKMQVQQLMKKSGDFESESSQSKSFPAYKTNKTGWRMSVTHTGTV